MVSTRTPAPRELLDEVNERRVRRDTQGVLALCEECWSSYRDGSLLDPVGLAAVLQVGFLATLQDGHPTTQLWRARAMCVAAQTGELKTTALLLVPHMSNLAGEAIDTREAGDLERAAALFESALAVLDEVDSLRQTIEKQMTDGAPEPPGVPIRVLRRVCWEKRGYLLWRAERYDDAAVAYDEATLYIEGDDRGVIRVKAGKALCVAAVQSKGGSIESEPLLPALTELLSEAVAGGFADVAERLEMNIELLGQSEPPKAHDLVSIELE